MDERAYLLAALEWQWELGADEAIGDVALDRFAEAPPRAPEQPAAQIHAMARRPAAAAEPDIGQARAAAAGAPDLAALRAALSAYDHPLKQGARSTVFADGSPKARVMFIGEAPGAEEDRQGKPFVGRSGALLDRMLAAIGLDRASDDPAKAAYITNVVPWRPLANRTPSPDEIAQLLPFVERHVALIDPAVVVLLGGVSAKAMLNAAEGITRLRGKWAEVCGRPAIATLHPAYLLRTPQAKGLAWADLLALRAHLDKGPS